MQRNKFVSLICVLSAFVFVYNGCGPEESSAPNVIAEASYCGSAIAQSGSTVTITGSAGYYYRTPGPSGLSNVSASTKPIRFAEIHVVDASNNIKQCAETDGSGNFSFTVSQSSSTLSIQIISRANNSTYKVSVLNDPTNNQYYKITKSFVASSSQAVGAITAPATGTLEGGAFNILDKILDANLFLSTTTNGCGFSGTYGGNAFSCIPYTPDHKVQVYWKPGFNPNVYVGGPADETLSFYDPEEDKLYICGGVAGDVDNSDTDHFDSSIIIHEYGHFIEAHYSKSDSPGGPHSGTKALDPRLTLSEGFANFFQAAVQSLNSDPRYIDTIGNPSGSASVAFYVPMEYKCSNNTNNCAGSPSPFDAAVDTGEGNFREFAISRTLYDIADTNNEDVDNVSGGFAEIWTAFRAMRSLPVAFRNIGLLLKIQAAITGATNVSAIVTSERQVANLSAYSTPDAGGACTPSIAASSPINSYNTRDSSWPQNGALFFSGHFYDYLASTGSVTFTLNYPTTNGRDLDIFIFREDHLLYYVPTMVNYNAQSASQEGGNISVSTSLTPGAHYLIYVHYYSGSGSASYTLRANGVQICPGS